MAEEGGLLGGVRIEAELDGGGCPGDCCNEPGDGGAGEEVGPWWGDLSGDVDQSCAGDEGGVGFAGVVCEVDGWIEGPGEGRVPLVLSRHGERRVGGAWEGFAQTCGVGTSRRMSRECC